MQQLLGVSTLLVILLCYYLINGPEDVSQIALPDYTVIPADEPEQLDTDPFAAVTAENVLLVLDSLTPLEAYHSIMALEYYWEDGSMVQTAEVWSRDDAVYITLTREEGSVQQMLLREDGAWLWYDDEEPTQMPQRPVGDLIGIPDYRELRQTSVVSEAQYVTLAGSSRTTCIYLRWELPEGRNLACWVSPETGLLERAVLEENGSMIYRMQQRSVERLLPGDDAYQTQFLLPGESLEQ